MNNYIIATIRRWNIELFEKKIEEWGNNWYLLSAKTGLNIEYIKDTKPKYIFFPHWSEIIPKEIYENYKCIGFHCTDLPDGRGGSPLQNLIERGDKRTVITAFRVTKELDSGGIYARRDMSLEGLAEEIYIRMGNIISCIIEDITDTHIVPKPQEEFTGQTLFKRRIPLQSEIPLVSDLWQSKMNNVHSEFGLEKLFDFIRMLDAEDYPPAFIDYGNFRLTFTRPALRTGRIVCDVEIKEKI